MPLDSIRCIDIHCNMYVQQEYYTVEDCLKVSILECHIALLISSIYVGILLALGVCPVPYLYRIDSLAEPVCIIS